MFEKRLADTFQRIFDFNEVSYNRASDMKEQEGVFVEIESARSNVKDGRFVCKVTGRIRVFAQHDKLPFGYFSKKLSQASLDDTKDLFFFDFEENAGQFQNLVERSLGFTYLFDGQYDPAQGTLNQVNLSIAEN